jgi:hypothetical protein
LGQYKIRLTLDKEKKEKRKRKKKRPIEAQNLSPTGLEEK